MIDNYRKGKILLSEERFSKLVLSLGENRQKYFINHIIKKEGNWGQIIGGIKAYKINKKYFEEGRKKGARSRNEFGVKYYFDINMPLSEELCEFVGVIIGDGCTNKYGHMYQTQIAGDKRLDREYYSSHFVSICKTLFGITPKIIIRPSGMYVNLYSKRVFELLTGRFKIPAGVKCYTIEIPQEIMDSPNQMLKFTLRGMFNTDGGVGIDKRKAYKRPYIRVNYTSASPKLIEQIRSFLNESQIFHSVHDINNFRAKQIQINGSQNVKLFLKQIGFSNPRHLNKVRDLL
ncbi:MAG: LAGLIDADG family homing endonuclease [archaeon]